jgi:hypothetical protein
MTEQMKAAFIRSMYGGVITAAIAFFAILQTAAVRTSETFGDAGVAAGAAFFGYLMLRGLAEGLIDSGRASSGNVTPADVGQPRR